MNAHSSKLIEERFLSTLQNYRLCNSEERILIGLSGGADSVLLSYLFNKMASQLNITPIALHIHHQLRGKEADRDAKFAEQLCRKLGIDFLLRKADVKKEALATGESIEMAGRRLRYQIFSQTAMELDCQRIATAHNLDDLIETMLLRLFKGTGLQGLQGIPIVRGKIIRPLLLIPRNDIEDYLNYHHIDYIVDSSNQDISIERNYIRIKLIPHIEQRFPAFRSKFLSLWKIINLENQFWNEHLEIYDRYMSVNKGRVIIDKRIFDEGIHPAVFRRWMRRLIQKYFQTDFYPSLSFYKNISKFIYNYKGNHTLFENLKFRLLSSYDKFILENQGKNFQNSQKYVKIKNSYEIYYPPFHFSFTKVTIAGNEISKNNILCGYIRATDNLEYLIRHPLPGDRLSIKGGHKKLQDLFVDLKLETNDRKNAAVIQAMNGEIAAVYIPGRGFRVSRDFYLPDHPTAAIRVVVSEQKPIQ